jgi:dethiobiotin synthetase
VNYFITGTDTGIGKTYVTCLLLRELNRQGRRAVGFKPICCGDRDDVEALAAAGADPSPSVDELNPIWYRTPASPLAGSLIENKACDPQRVVKAYRSLAARFDAVLVEGVGGWDVPIRRDYFTSHLAMELGLPVVVVVANRLGALNHTILTVRAITRCGLTCAGIILNHLSGERDPAGVSHASLIEEILHVPVWTEIRYLDKQLAPDLVARL